MLEKGSSSSISRGLHTSAQGDGHPLLLAAGELVRITIPQPLQINQRQRLVHLLLTGAAIEFGQAEADVVGHRQVGKRA